MQYTNSHKMKPKLNWKQNYESKGKITIINYSLKRIVAVTFCPLHKCHHGK